MFSGNRLLYYTNNLLPLLFLVFYLIVMFSFACFWTLNKWNYTHDVFCNFFHSLITMFLRFIHAVICNLSWSFLLLCNIPLYTHTIIYLLILLLKDIWVKFLMILEHICCINLYMSPDAHVQGFLWFSPVIYFYHENFFMLTISNLQKNWKNKYI